jgi:hypothetical protein
LVIFDRSARCVAPSRLTRTTNLSQTNFVNFVTPTSITSSGGNATTEARDRFWMKRYGPSRRRA